MLLLFFEFLDKSFMQIIIWLYTPSAIGLSFYPLFPNKSNDLSNHQTFIPKKKPKNGFLTPEEKENNSLISSIRIKVDKTYAMFQPLIENLGSRPKRSAYFQL